MCPIQICQSTGLTINTTRDEQYGHTDKNKITKITKSDDQQHQIRVQSSTKKFNPLRILLPFFYLRAFILSSGSTKSTFFPTYSPYKLTYLSYFYSNTMSPTDSHQFYSEIMASSARAPTPTAPIIDIVLEQAFYKAISMQLISHQLNIQHTLHNALKSHREK